MGWTGSFIWWNNRESNKELFLRAYPSYRTEIENGTYKIAQSGSNVYILGESINGGKCVSCVLCRRYKKDGEFCTKFIDAISNHCFGFPQSWIAELNQDDPDVQQYIKARQEDKAKKQKYEIGDLIECVAHREIFWSDYFTVKENDTFYIKVERWTSHSGRKNKHYVVYTKDKDGSFGRTHFRLTQKTFKYLKQRTRIE